MKIRIIHLLIVFLLIGKLGLGQNVPASTIHILNDAITKTMIPDGINPPLASRMYVYPNLCFLTIYEQVSGQETGLRSKLLRFPKLPTATRQVDSWLAASMVFQEVAKSMLYRPELFKELSKNALKSQISDVDTTTLIATKNYVDRCLPILNVWISSDNYSGIKAMPDYILRETPDAWEPTPPNYYDALEPNWYRLKPLIDVALDSLIFQIPIPFDTSQSSEFYRQAKHVYDVVNTSTEEQYNIAKFWDCNPLTVHLEGHFSIDSKQMTPGGHWIGITGIACEKENLDIKETSYAYCQTSLALFHGFILAWQTKYEQDLIRPETYINRYIDPDWRPLLETPPFPEYTSAHSVISMAAAKVLTKRFGENYNFRDTMELAFGLPERTFESFIEAAEEVSASRVFGGIHYSMGVEDGMKQGAVLGDSLNKILEND